MPRTLTADFRQAGFAAQVPLADIFNRWQQRRRYRAQLRELLIMGPHLIADFGMTMAEAEEEAGLPFWRSSIVPPLRPL